MVELILPHVSFWSPLVSMPHQRQWGLPGQAPQLPLTIGVAVPGIDLGCSCRGL